MTADSRVELIVDGRAVVVADDGASLLEVLRDRLGVLGAKDGCSPQGQCGCCTVLVDGAPRVSCVTPVKRVAGRAITTIDGLANADRWATRSVRRREPVRVLHSGIIVRLDALRAAGAIATDVDKVERALLAHLCRCTGWRSILDAWGVFDTLDTSGSGRDLDAASQRAAIEGGGPQRVGPEVALGRGGFADDTAPHDALVAVPDGAGGWAVAETLTEARRAAAKTKGRRTTVDVAHPVRVPTVSGSRRCRRHGSSRRISSSTRHGARRAASRRRRSRTGARSEERRRRR